MTKQYKLRGYITHRNEDGTLYVMETHQRGENLTIFSTQDDREKFWFDADDAIPLMQAMEQQGYYQVKFHAQVYPANSTES